VLEHGPTPRGWLLQALYTSAELCLIGDTSSLGALGRTLQESLETPIVVDLVEREPAPYDGCRLSLVVEVSDGAVVIGRKETTLTTHGGREQIAMLGSNLTWLATNQDPADPLAHIHLEHLPDYPDGYYIGPESVPLVVELVTEI